MLRRRAGDAALVLLLLVLALGAVAQVRHNADTGPHGRAPHLNPVALRVAHVR
jgi:hypothetical protein